MTERGKDRKAYYLSGPLRNSKRSQDARRFEALDFQKQARQNVWDLARSCSSLDLLGDLHLKSDTSDDETAKTTSSAVTSSAEQTIKKKKLKNFFPWAKGLLMHAESLDLKDGLLPPGLDTDWSVVIAPKGKRVVVVSGFSTGANTVLLARASGRSLERRSTILPPDCILDCLYDRDINTIWVLDLIKWRGVYYVDFDFSFRSFFLASKLSELPLQPYILPNSGTSSRKSPLLVLPAPYHSAPLIPSTLLSIMSTVAIPTTITVSVLSISSTQSQSANNENPNPIPIQPKAITIPIPFSTTGFLIFLNSAIYHSGPTTLAAWVPNDVSRGREEFEGLGRLGRLVEEWNERGGPARILEIEVSEENGNGMEVVGDQSNSTQDRTVAGSVSGEGDMDLSDD